MIYFLTIYLQQEVHAGCLGFTKTLPMYGWGPDADAAILAVRAHLHSQGLAVEKCASSTVAKQQDLKRYTFPEQIYGAPPELIEPVLRARLERDWPLDMVEKDILKHRTIYQGIQKSLQELAAVPA